MALLGRSLPFLITSMLLTFDIIVYASHNDRQGHDCQHYDPEDYVHSLTEMGRVLFTLQQGYPLTNPQNMQYNISVPNMNKTDSICASVAYSYLERQIEHNDCYPIITKPLNQQALMLFEKFNHPAPKQIPNLQPRAFHIVKEMSKLVTINENESVARAMEIYYIYKYHYLPTLDSSNRVTGVLSFSSLFDLFLTSRDESVLANVQTSVGLVAQTLKAYRVNKCMVNDCIKKYSIVALSGEDQHLRDQLGTYGEFGSTIFITAHNPGLVQFLADNGAAVIVLCNTLPPAADPGEADERSLQASTRLLSREVPPPAAAGGPNTVIIETEMSVTLVAYLIRQATPITDHINKTSAVVRQSTALSDIKMRMQQSGFNAVAVVDADGHLTGVVTRQDLFREDVLNVSLVGCPIDHAPDGIQHPNVFIRRVISANAVSNVETAYPIEFIVRPLGCCSTIVDQLFQEKGILPPISVAGILLGGIVSGTKNLQVATQADLAAVRRLETISGVSRIELSRNLFEMAGAGGDLQEQVRSDVKQYKIKNGRQVQISQFEVISLKSVVTQDHVQHILEYLPLEEGTVFNGVMITDVVRGKSVLVYRCSEDELLGKLSFNNYKGIENCLALQKIISRKKQLMPYLLGVWG